MLILLAIIYLAFISLGLPDSVLGSSWPMMSQELNVSLEFAGIVSIVVTLATVISSLYSTKMINHLGTGKVVVISVLMTSLALLGFASSYHIFTLILLACVLGLGAGAIDAALNNFVALHYKSKHMNYLHSFWGVGATAGPLIMANYLTIESGWRYGYATLATIQFVLVAILITTLPLWKKVTLISTDLPDTVEKEASTSNKDALKIGGVKTQLVLFCSYCSLEVSTGLWAASYLTQAKGISASDAAFWTAIYFLGITVGRLLCGWLTSKINEQQLIQIGLWIILFGIVMLLLPLPTNLNQIALLFIGLGCAPVYPNTIHLTPKRFGHKTSQVVIGLSMATAYTGMTIISPLIGLVMANISFSLFPYLLLILCLIMQAVNRRLNTKFIRIPPQIRTHDVN